MKKRLGKLPGFYLNQSGMVEFVGEIYSRPSLEYCKDPNRLKFAELVQGHGTLESEVISALELSGIDYKILEETDFFKKIFIPSHSLNRPSVERKSQDSGRAT